MTRGMALAEYESFGERVRRLREARRATAPEFSLRQFAQRVGISATFLSKIETGEFSPPSAENIKKMAELLGDDPDELLALAGKVDPDLNRIIMGRPRAMADFLRAARDAGLSEKRLRELTENIRRGKAKG